MPEFSVPLPAKGNTDWYDHYAALDKTVRGRNVLTALPLVFAGLANRGVTPFRVLGLGSSSMSGANATTNARCFFDLLIRAIQTAWSSGTGSETAILHTNTNTFGTVSTAAGVHGYDGAEGGKNAATYVDNDEATRIIALAPQLIIHMVGANDYTEGRALAAYKADVLARVTQFRDSIPNCVQILVHSYQRWDQNPSIPWSSYGDQLRDIAVSNPLRVAFIDVSSDFAAVGVPSTDPWNLIDTDNIHQTDIGHSFMADLLGRIIGIPRQPVAPILGAAPSDTTAPTISSFTATPSAGQIVWAWSGADNVGITRWVLKRGSTTLYDGASSVFTETGLTNGTPYGGTVVAYDAAGNVSATSTASATPAAPAGGLTMYASDSFNDSFTDITTRQSDSAYGGTARSYSATFGQAFASSGGRLVRGAGTGGNFAGFAGPVNGRIEITIVALPTTENAYLMARRSAVSGATGWYRLGVTPAGNLSLDRSAQTDLFSTVSGAVKAGDRIALDFNGSTFKAYVNDVQVGTTGTDSTVTAAGFVGISVQNGNTVFDDYKVQTY